MVYMPRNPLFINDFNDVAGSEGGGGIGYEVRAVEEEMLGGGVLGFMVFVWGFGGHLRGEGMGEGGRRRVREGKGRGGEVLFEKGIVDLFCGADFYSAHHLPGGDDDAAEGLGGGGHRVRISS